MGQFKILENLMLPLRSLDGALEILLVGRPMGGTIRQAAETVLPRSSGRPPPLFVVRASKRFWAVGEFALTLPSLKREKEISPMPLLSSFDINGSGEKDQLIVSFSVGCLRYEGLRSAALSQVSSDFFECMLCDLFGAVTRRLMFFMCGARPAYNI